MVFEFLSYLPRKKFNIKISSSILKAAPARNENMLSTFFGHFFLLSTFSFLHLFLRAKKYVVEIFKYYFSNYSDSDNKKAKIQGLHNQHIVKWVVKIAENNFK